MSTRASWFIAAVAVACFAAGGVLSHRIEPGVRVKAITLAGDTPALQFIPAGAGPHPVALLAHGATGSKENLFCYGEALAAAGFVCFSVDQPGHGASARPFTFIEAVRTLGQVARTVGPVDVFICQSMGGFTGGEAVREGGMKPGLFIALGSLPILGEPGPPLLLLAGRFDERFPPALLQARRDARLVLSPWSDHLLESYDPLLVNAAVEAACATVGKTPPASPTSWWWRLAGIALGLVGAVGLALCLPRLSSPWSWVHGLLVATIFIVAFVLTTNAWADVMPHPRHFPAQAAAIAITLLVLLALGRLRVPWWGFPALAAAVWLCAITVPYIRFILLSHPSRLTMAFLVEFVPALLIGTLLGRIAARSGSRFDGDLAMAIILGCALFQWHNPPKMASPEAPRAHVAIKLDARSYDACVGEYEFAVDNVHHEPFKFTVWRQGDHLAVQAWNNTTRESAFDYYPESETNFFHNIHDAQLTFLKNDQAEVTSVIFHLAWQPDSKGKKLSNPAN